MHPVAHERLDAGGAFGLGDFAFVVREDQIAAAAVDIDRRSQIGRAIALHSMCQPGRPGPQGESQVGSPGDGRLPQDEIERIALVRIVRRVAAFVRDRRAFLRGESCSAFRIQDLSQSRNTRCRCSRTRKPFSMRSSMIETISGTWSVARVKWSKSSALRSRHVRESFAVSRLPSSIPVDPEFFRLAKNVVIDIGDILNVGDVVAFGAEEAHEDVEREKGERMTDVGRVVRSHPAHIDADLVVHGGERFDQPGLRIEKTHRSRCSPKPPIAVTEWLFAL